MRRSAVCLLESRLLSHTFGEMRRQLALPAVLVATVAAPAAAVDIYATDFNTYSTGTLSGQLAWIGSGTWAVSGAVNSPQVAQTPTRSSVWPPGFAVIAATGKASRRMRTKIPRTSQVQALLLASCGVWKRLTAKQLIAYSRGQML